MKQLDYLVRFTTPAFLGNAEQSGQWRTPPFKALLRQWWRVAYAAEHRFSVRVDEMRHEEGLLFGHAWLENDIFERDGRQVKTAARKSLVRLRLDRWDGGKQTSWQALPTVEHREVKFAVGSDLYLGYGPLTLPKGAKTPTLKANAAIQAGESATLSLAVPEEHAARIERALWLMNRYGTLGGRSRNGWGSFALTPPAPGKESGERETLPLRPWRDCLDRDWPHAIGVDDQGPLAWQTEAFDDWKLAMRRLAEIKIGLRTQFIFTSGKDAPAPEARHWLSYPVTHHSVKPWGNNARLPNSLRLKVCPAVNDPRQVVGVIFHVPCLPPPAFNPNRTEIERVWQQVHAFLDAPAQKLTRIPA
jgi:CRISPR-associated protein Cmr1